MSHRVRVCHHRGPCCGSGPERRGIFRHAGQLLPALLVSGLHGPGPTETPQIIMGFGQVKLHFSSSVANSLLFLHSWTMDHATKLTVFYDERAVLQPASLFVFPKSTGCQRICFLPSAVCGDLVYSRENSYSNLSYQEIFFLQSFAFMLKN